MKPSKQRRQIAWEAARLISEQPELTNSVARRQAVERLFPDGIRDRDIPSTIEVGAQLRAIVGGLSTVEWENRFARYAVLLEPLSQVKQDPRTHPEGDVLYHSLQVFQLVQQAYSYDEELLTAALLHDVGKAIDRRNPVAASLAALADLVTPRTGWFIEQLPVARAYLQGELGVRARRRLEAEDDFEELLCLAESDIAGRACGIPVPEFEAALKQIRALSLSDPG